MSHRAKLCVVDDDREAAAVLCGGLSLHDYEAVEAHSGQAALEICEKGDIDMVLLDVAMPQMDGYEVCRRLKANPLTKDIAVAFVTVKGAAEDISRGFSLGATDYITKPYTLPMVMIRVEAALRNQSVRGRIRSTNDGISDTANTDGLTGLRNRRYLMDRLQEEVDKAHRYDYPVSCVVVDVDEIEACDEEAGTVSIDDLLAEVALTLRTYTRTHDVVARYDGTLFATLLPHAPIEDAKGYGEKIMGEVDATTFSDPNFPTKARLSVGIVTCENGSARGADFVFGEAMRSLLKAKSQTDPRLLARQLSDV